MESCAMIIGMSVLEYMLKVWRANLKKIKNKLFEYCLLTTYSSTQITRRLVIEASNSMSHLSRCFDNWMPRYLDIEAYIILCFNNQMLRYLDASISWFLKSGYWGIHSVHYAWITRCFDIWMPRYLDLKKSGYWGTHNTMLQ